MNINDIEFVVSSDEHFDQLNSFVETIINDTDKSIMVKDRNSYLTTPNQTGFFAVYNEKIIAAIGATHDKTAGNVYLRGLYVLKEHRKMGIGSNIITTAINHYGKSISYEAEIVNDDIASRCLLENIGFIKVTKKPYATNTISMLCHKFVYSPNLFFKNANIVIPPRGDFELQIDFVIKMNKLGNFYILVAYDYETMYPFMSVICSKRPNKESYEFLFYIHNKDWARVYVAKEIPLNTNVLVKCGIFNGKMYLNVNGDIKESEHNCAESRNNPNESKQLVTFGCPPFANGAKLNIHGKNAVHFGKARIKTTNILGGSVFNKISTKNNLITKKTNNIGDESPYYKAVTFDRTSHYDKRTRWEVGKTIVSSAFDLNPEHDSVEGIHCTRTLLYAVCYQTSPSIYITVRPNNIVNDNGAKVRCESADALSWLTQKETDELAGFNLWEVNHPINPLLMVADQNIDKEYLLNEWIKVNHIAGASVWATVSDIFRFAVWESVRNTVRLAAGDTIENTIRNAVGLDDWRIAGPSVRDATEAYLGGLFPCITTWKHTDVNDPWKALLTLWYGGYIPSFDGKTWRLHAGPKAEVVFELPKSGDKL